MIIDEKYELKQSFLYILEISKNKMIVKSHLYEIYNWYQLSVKDIIPFSWLTKKEEVEFDDFENFCKYNKQEGIKRVNLFFKAIDKATHSNKFILNQKSTLENQLQVLQELFSLTDTEKNILNIILLYQNTPLFEQFIDGIYNNNNDLNKITKLLCQCLNITLQKLKTLISKESNLFKKRLLEQSHFGYGPSCTSLCCEMLKNNFSNKQELQQIFLKQSLKSDLIWDDFKHIEHIQLVKKLFSHIRNAHQNGINILLHGDIGTGKTEFAKVLCQETDFSLYSICGSENLLGNRNRLDDLVIIQTLLESTNDNCLLIDEADDIFIQHFFSNTKINKITINQALESNHIPVIWIMNDISHLDPAYLRRFNYIFEFTKPTLAMSKKIWQKLLCKYQLIINEDQIEHLAKHYALSPSFINSALKTTKLINGEFNELEQQIRLLQKAINPDYCLSLDDDPKSMFIPQLLNTDLDLIKLTNKLKENQRLDFSLCLYGVSGTGKSTYAKYLAETLNMPIIKKQCTDLLSMWVGGNEKNIKAAFEEAKQKKAILLFDEADSFLQNRQHANHSWEITMVNQMLTCMEEHPFPFICTTNLIDVLDQASLRRFTFKVKYDFMNEQQAKLAFSSFFNVQNPPELNFATLTVGDFIVTKKKAEYFGELDDIQQLIEVLKQEQLNKPQPKNPIGFI